MVLELYPVNYLAVVIATIVQMAIGFYWYSPSGFGKEWLKLIKLSDKEMKKMKEKGMASSMIIGIISAFIMVFMLAQSISASNLASVADYMEMAFWLWLGFIATTMVGFVIWEGKSWKLYFINTGFYLIAFLIDAIILFYL